MIGDPRYVHTSRKIPLVAYIFTQRVYTYTTVCAQMTTADNQSRKVIQIFAL